MARQAQPFEVDFIGLERFAGKLEQMMEIGEDFSNEFQGIAGNLWLHFEEVFRAEGPGWKPLAQRTQNERAAQGYDPKHPILERTGVFKESFMSNAEIQMDPTFLVYRSRDRRAEELVLDRRVVEEIPIVELVEKTFSEIFSDRVEQVWRR